MQMLCNIGISLLLVGSSIALEAQAETPLQERLQEAEQIYRRDGPEAALPLFDQLVLESENSGDALQQGIAVHFVGEIHWRLGSYDQAAEYLYAALKLKQGEGNRLQQAKTLNVLGLLNWDLGDYAQARSYFRQGTEIAEELGDKRLQGALLNNLSLVHDEIGDYHVSLEQYQHVLELYESVDFPRGTGDTLGNIGGVYLLLGRFRDALAYYEQALAISETLESTAAMSQDNGNIGLCQLGLGQTDLAVEHFETAINLSANSGMQQDQAYWLRQLGNAFIQKGRYDMGLESHRSALDIYEQLEGKTELAEALHDMGQLHLLLGDASSAGRYFSQAIELSREIGLSRGITINLLALGDLQRRRDGLEEAAALYSQALQRAKETGEMTLWSDSLLRLAEVHRDQQYFQSAMTEADQALDIARETGALGLESQAIYARAELNRLQGNLDLALSGFNRASTTLANAPGPELEWRVLYGKGLTLAASGDKKAAIVALQSAITLIEGVRDHLREERFRAGYVQDKYQVYVDLVRLQLEAGRQEDAFSTAERLRSRSFLDLVEGGRAPDSGDAAQMREFAFKERIRVLREALAEENNQIRQEQRQLAISAYSQELIIAERDYQAFLDDRRRSGAASRNYDVPTYSDIRLSLSENEALIEYVVGKNNVMLFVLTRDSLTTDTVSLRREDLDNKVELIRNLIRRQEGARWMKPAASLATFLLDPIMSSGQLDGVTHLYLVPHGTLNYLPFALLPSNAGDTRRVIEDFTLAYLPTASTLLRTKVDQAGTSSMLTMAPARSRLQFAGAEARAINVMFAPDSTALLGESATESAFKEEAANYRLLHLATHGYFNKLNPLLSGLELESDAGNDGQLELHEILGMQLAAELVTLSACQTGLGSGHFAETPAGDDFVGLTRAFLYAGSTSVLATLWEVDDASTLGLMKNFYGSLRQDDAGTDKAGALATAQRAFLSSKDYKHPYFWAPFVLVGEMGRVNSI